MGMLEQEEQGLIDYRVVGVEYSKTASEGEPKRSISTFGHIIHHSTESHNDGSHESIGAIQHSTAIETSPMSRSKMILRSTFQAKKSWTKYSGTSAPGECSDLLV